MRQAGMQIGNVGNKSSEKGKEMKKIQIDERVSEIKVWNYE